MDIAAMIAKRPLAIEGLSAEECAEVVARREAALAEAGRVEFDDSAMRVLVDAFRDVVDAFPVEAVEVFYAVRDDAPFSVPDAEIADALALAFRDAGCEMGPIDAVELARELRARELASYSISDDAGNVYRWDPCDWEYDECARGWDGELWEADYDE